MRAGVAYQVGERGPETFVPGANGAIVRNGAALQAHLSVVVPVTLHVQHSAREAFKAATTWTRYGGGKAVGID